jgi:tRNA A-37 threonylcarbamoyl transferase component Bud32
MYRTAAPWWMYLAAASFLAYFTLLAWCGLRGVEEPGISAEFENGFLRVERVVPDSPAARAGLRPGDGLFMADGRAIRSRFDWMALTSNWEPGKSARYVVERGGKRQPVVLETGRRDWRDWGLGRIVITLLMWGARLTTLLVALLMVYYRPRVLLVRIGAWFLGAAALSSVILLPGQAAVWRQLPGIAGVLLWGPALSTVVLPAIFFTFYARYPRKVLGDRRVWQAVYLPAAAQLAGGGRYLYAVIYTPEQALGVLPDWYLPLHAASSLLYLVAGVAIEVANWRRAPGAGERRAALMLALAATVCWAAVVPIVLLDWRGGASSLAPAFFSTRGTVISAALFLACILSLSFTLLRGRVFGFSVIIRSGLRYALARRFLVSIAPTAGILLVADLLIHGQQPLLQIVEARGWIYAGLVGLGLFALSRREIWLESLNRRFFREHYDADKMLMEVAEMVRKATGFEQVAPRVVAQVEGALHLEFASIMVRETNDAAYRSIAASPAGQAPPPLRSDSKLMSLVRMLGKPFEVTANSDWLREKLPSQDTEFVRQARIDLLVPVETAPEGRDAILALGSKRSEEPYSEQDRTLLSAIAANLALLLDRPAPRFASYEDSNFCRECPRCGACYESSIDTCSNEGSPLTRRAYPRVLVGRYRLEHRLDEGGMGAVYEAIDLALERRVAAKIIHDRLAESDEATDRFRREARAAAAFTHPNIVTVHDFGVVAESRPFLVMELLKGISLRKEIDQAKRLPPARTVQIQRDVCEAVEAAHLRQLVHRDLKPANIFLVRSENREVAKVLDFGVAKWLRPAPSSMAETMSRGGTGVGVLVGTIPYMSPEQLLGGEPEAGWDLWALAVVAYEMLTGKHPFAAPTLGECREAILAARFALATEVVPQGPRKWDRFFGKALARDPKERPKSARELLAELENAVG